jgi:hypothetical protein
MKAKLQHILAKAGMYFSPRNRRGGIVPMVALSSFLLSGSTAPVACKPDPPPNHTGLDVAIGAIAVGAVIGTVLLVDAQNKKHAIKGCVTAGQNGLQVQDVGDKKSYTLLGVTANTKVGDVVKLHGVKEKPKKDGGGDPAFVVEKVSRDYGPCTLGSGPAASTATSPATAQAQ